MRSFSSCGALILKDNKPTIERRCCVVDAMVHQINFWLQGILRCEDAV
jgi:hypothetical protein